MSLVAMEPVKVELMVTPMLIPGETLRLAAHFSPELKPKLERESMSTTTSSATFSTEESPDAESVGVKPPPGLPPPLGLPSHGSLLHATGECRPCMWFWKSSGCARADECLHCHLCPKQARYRRRRVKAARAESDGMAKSQFIPGVHLEEQPCKLSCLEEPQFLTTRPMVAKPLRSSDLDLDEATTSLGSSDGESMGIESSSASEPGFFNSPPCLASPRETLPMQPPGVFF